MALPQEAITTDHQLEEIADKASGQLAKHRWHWTLNEANPERVSIAEYARRVSRAASAISSHANGYATWLDENTSTGTPVDLSRHVNRAAVGADMHAAAQAVASARDMSASTVDRFRREEIKRVRDWSRDRAEKRGTTVEEEAPHVAEQIVKQEKADARLAEERKAKLGLRFVKAENILANMYRRGQEALAEMRDVPWDDEQRELLVGAMANIKALLNLIDMALTGAADVDWDAEMAKLS